MSRSSSSAQGYGAAHRRARLIVLARDHETCQWCGGPAPVHGRPGIPPGEADHLGAKVPDPAGMVAACRRCNARRGGRKGVALRADPGPSRAW